MSMIRFRALGGLLRYAMLFSGLGILFVVGTCLNSPEEPGDPNVFLSIANQRDVLSYVAINGILAVGMTLVILTAGIDLSVGSVMSLCTVVCAMLLMQRADAGEALSRAHLIVLPAVALFAGLFGFRAGRMIKPRSGPAAAWLGMCGAVLLAVLALALVWWRIPLGFGTLAVLLVIPPVGGMLGAVNGVIIARTRLQPFIVTLAMMIAAVGLAKYIAGAGGQVHPIYKGTPEQPGVAESFPKLGAPILTVGQETLRNGRVRDVKLLPVPGLFLLGCWVAAAFVLHLLPLGRYIYAVGGNEETSRLSGVPVERVKIFVYGASGLLAGLAAVLYCAQYMQGKADAGQMKELDAIAAVVIGGTSLMGGRGSILGTLVGVMIFGYLTNILQLRSVSSEIQDIVKGVIIVGAAALQSGNIGVPLGALFRRRPPARILSKPAAGGEGREPT